MQHTRLLCGIARNVLRVMKCEFLRFPILVREPKRICCDTQVVLVAVPRIICMCPILYVKKAMPIASFAICGICRLRLCEPIKKAHNNSCITKVIFYIERTPFVAKKHIPKHKITCQRDRRHHHLQGLHKLVQMGQVVGYTSHQ